MWIRKYNEERPYPGRYFYGKTPQQTSLENMLVGLQKDLSREGDPSESFTEASPLSDNSNLSDEVLIIIVG